jgi:predicted transcriptional regulator of viral defense system
MTSGLRQPGGHGRKTSSRRTYFDHATAWGAVVALASAQHAMVSLRQLTELDLPSSTVRNWLAAHRLHRIHHAVYALVPRALLTPRGHWMAAVLACGPDGILSHRTAAALHGLRPTARANIEVTVPARNGRKHTGIDIHRSTTLRAQDVTVVDGIPCTTAARTLLDIAALLPARPIERAFDQWDQMGEFDLNAILDQLERNPNHRGARVVRSILDGYYVGSAPTESELEEAALALCRRLELPMPLVQRPLILPDGGPALRPDFAWVEQRVILEADGDKVHRTRQAREARNVRDQRLLVHGWSPLHASWRQITRRPHELGPTLVRLVRSSAPACVRAARG